MTQGNNKSKIKDAAYLQKENDAYNALVAAGYRPQGMDLKTNMVVIMKIERGNTNDEHREIWYFEDWQTAETELLEHSMYETFKKYAVSAKSVEDFCYRYHRRGAYHDRGADYMACDLARHLREFERDGMTCIPQGLSTTGDVVAYYGAEVTV